MHKIQFNYFSLLLCIGVGVSCYLVYAKSTSFEEVNSQVVIFKNLQQQGLIITGEHSSVVIDPINQDTAQEIKSYLSSNNKS